MNLFMGLMTDPFIAGRGDGVSGGHRQAHRPTPRKTSRLRRKPNDALCGDLHARRRRRSVRGSAGACGRRASAARRPPTATRRSGSNNTTSRICGTAVGADYRFSPNTHRRLCARRRRHQLQRRQWRHRALRPVPGRRLRAPHRRPGLCSARAGLWLAGRHHRPHRDDRRPRPAAGPASTPTPFRDASKAAIASSRRWLGGVGITPYAAGQFTTFDLPAYAEQASVGAMPSRWPMAPRTSPTRAANSACAPTNPSRCTDAILTLRGRLAWAHDFNPDRAIGATFQTLPGASLRRQRRGAGPDSR